MIISLLHTQASNARPPQRHCIPHPLPAQHIALPRLPKGEEKDLRTGTYLGLHSGTAGEEPQRKKRRQTEGGTGTERRHGGQASAAAGEPAAGPAGRRGQGQLPAGPCLRVTRRQGPRG